MRSTPPDGLRVVTGMFVVRKLFDLLALILAAAWAAPERPGAMADTNALGSTAGATRNAAARIGTKNLCDMNVLPASALVAVRRRTIA
jgi:hypothetical protein